MAEIKNELSRIIEYHNTLLPECSRKHPAEIVSIIDKTVSDWDNGSFNFANYKSIHLKQNGQVRTVKQFEDWSTELFLCIYLKRCIDRAYRIKYPNRNDHMHLLFGLIRSLQDMKDFVIVKYDFKDFFNSISSEYVFYKYLNKSNLSRQQKHLLQQFTSACPFCFAGINTSNVMAEVISKDFDRTLTTALIGKGLIFSKRYVDDGILIFNKYVSKNELEEIVNNVINKVFYDVDISVTNKCTTALNPTKFTYVSKRIIDSNPGTSFDFNYLGYQFLLTSNNTPTRKRTAIRYGITQEKIQKYSKKLDDIVQEYKSDGNLELLRHKLRAFCSRTVYRRKRYSSMVWKVKGFTSNYNELRYHLGQLDADTERFLKNGVLDAFVRSNIPYPYFLCDESEESPYNLYGCMKRNRTLLFEENERIGINKVTLEKMCKQVNDGRSDSAIAHCRGMLFQIFNKAAANDLIMKNPVQYADKMRKRPKKRKEAFTADEVRALLRDLPDNQIGWSIRLLLCTGMRGQELLALEPRHIAKDGSTITIEQALVRVKGSVEIGTPKSQDSYRTIPVPENVQYCARLLRDTPNKFIWESPKNVGMPCNPTHFADRFKAAISKVKGVRVLTPHCCRHTYVSQMQALGVSVETIQSIVGHADMDMTRHYLHVQENVRKEAVDRLSEAFAKKGKGTFGNVLDYKKSS